MKVHRVVAPLAIVLGIVNVLVGRAWSGNGLPIWGFVSLGCMVIALVLCLWVVQRRNAAKRGNAPANAAGWGFQPRTAAYTQIKPEVDFNTVPAPYGDRDVPLQSMDLGQRHENVQYYDPVPDRQRPAP